MLNRDSGGALLTPALLIFHAVICRAIVIDWQMSGSLPQHASSGSAHSRLGSRGGGQEPVAPPVRKVGVWHHLSKLAKVPLGLHLLRCCEATSVRLLLSHDSLLTGRILQVQLSSGVAGGIIPELFRPEDLLGSSVTASAQVPLLTSSRAGSEPGTCMTTCEGSVQP